MNKGVLRAFEKLVATLASGWLCFVIGKILFLLGNHTIYNDLPSGEWWRIIAHGFSMDLSMAAYLSLVPAILLCVAVAYGSRGIINRILDGYFIIMSLIISLIVILDTGLYGYWLFKLDATPLFYFLSSPASALASAEWWMYPLAIIGWLLLAAVYLLLYHLCVIKLPGEVEPSHSLKSRVTGISLMVVATLLLIIPIRGGVTVSTMNLSRAYYSDDRKINHAAVNPAFSLMYSLSHQNDFASQFRFLPPERAAELFNSMTDLPADSVPALLGDNKRPDIYLLILESFSSHLFPSLGGEAIATNLDEIAAEGLLFDNFYANSFRTDRGLVSILSAYPGQPNTSIMKFVSKTENLPSLAKLLKEKADYSTTYYYGGDANFTNMKAYLVNGGFSRIISDVDFPVAERLSKWGAHDEVLFNKVISELTHYDHTKPQLKVIQTSSSHEPFEVPYDDKGRFSDIRAKAFAYTDSCTALFIHALKASDSWDNSLVVIVPDHYGAYPELTEPLPRHRVPLIISGGALGRHGRVSTPGSQTDIAATLAASLGLDHSPIIFSHNLLNRKSPHFGFFTEPGVMGMVTENDTVIYNLDTDTPLAGEPANIEKAKAYLQTLYDDLSKR